MRTQAVIIPIAALAIAFGSFSEAAAQSRERRTRGNQEQNQEGSRSGDDWARPRGDRSNSDRSSANRGGERTERADRGDRDRQDQERERQRATSTPRQRDTDVNRDDWASARSGSRDSGGAERYSRDAYRGSRESQRSRGYDTRRENDRGGYSDRRGGYSDRRGEYPERRGGYNRGYNNGYSRGYYAPRLLQRRSSPRRYYGSGARLSLYFGIGSGYRYGSPYSGRVYGYRRSVPTYNSYGNYVLYGDLRLKVSPREAAVYVDGYYAGIVDDFDGFFQRLTIEAGPHEIEIEAEGYGSQVFDVYVDPERTIDLHADLWR